MPAEFESGFFGDRIPAWHRLGTVIDEDVVTTEEAITLAGLDWEVEMMPIYAQTPRGAVEIETHQATVRNSDSSILGVVGKQWTPVQNRAAFAFMDELVQSDEAKFHTAGSLYGGRRVWMLARIPRDILIGGEEGERVAPFLLLSNGHDGTAALRVTVTPIRVVCANTLSLALHSAVRSWATRHTLNVQQRVAEARKTLELTFRYYDVFEELGNSLVGQEFSDRAMGKMLREIMPIKKPDEGAQIVVNSWGDPTDGGRAAKNVAEAREMVQSIFKSGDDLANVRGTKWAALQAVAEYADWMRPASDDERRALRSVEDVKLKSAALAYLAPDRAHKPGEALKVLAEV